ncbi:MAG: 6-phosphogluconolactonase [Bacteroidota bacterium]
MKIQKKIFEHKAAVADAFAEFLANEIHQSEQFNLALSGGSTPQILFDVLANDYAEKIDWAKVHLYWGDERCVAPDDPESNYGMTYERLIKKVAIPKENVWRVKGEEDPQAEANRYGKRIEWNLLLKDDLPIFDLVILGMGGDGHTASIFPHQIELLEIDKTCAVATHPDSGQRRITLTGRVINAAQQIHFLVTGASKQSVVREIFNKEGNYKNYPAAYIQNATWWMDEAAGKF